LRGQRARFTARRAVGDFQLRWAPAQVQGTAREGLAQGLQVASHFPAPVAPAMRDEVTAAFMSGLHAGCLAAAVVCLAGAIAMLAALPAHPLTTSSLT